MQTGVVAGPLVSAERDARLTLSGQYCLRGSSTRDLSTTRQQDRARHGLKKRVKKLFWSSWPLIGGGGSACAPSDAASVSLTPGSGSASQGLWRWRRELTQECNTMERGLIKRCAFVGKNLNHFLWEKFYIWNSGFCITHTVIFYAIFVSTKLLLRLVEACLPEAADSTWLLLVESLLSILDSPKTWTVA